MDVNMCIYVFVCVRPCVYLSVTLRNRRTRTRYRPVRVQKILLRLPDIYSQTVENFSPVFTHLLYVSIYARLQIVIQFISPTLTKLCHIKRDYLVHKKCSKCPPSAETHPFRRLCDCLQLCWSLSVASHYKI